MELQKIINSLDITSDNKDLLQNRSKFMINKKKNYSSNKEIKIERPIIIFSIKHSTIVEKWNSKKL